MLVHFREKIGAELINQINSDMIKTQGKNQEDEEEKKHKIRRNQGKLIIDATCAPADISYPTDLNLLNNARIKTEKIIDILYKTIKSQFQNKPITHRKTAKKEYLKVAKKRRPTRKVIRKAIKKQLKYISYKY
jgi:high-affinity Fe2+/Pb2+ permease